MAPKYTHHLFAPLLVAVALGLAAGCGDDATAPEITDAPIGPSPFYPLEIGDAWTYRTTFVLAFFDPDTDELLDADTLAADFDVSMTGVDTIGGVEYVVETTIVWDDEIGDTTWVRLRQDDEGLYRADISQNVPPGDEDLDEFTDPPPERVRLRYPLSVGAEWDLYSAANPVTATVEAIDTLDVPGGSLGAWRVRVVAPRQGPDDWYSAWYNRCGLMHEAQHAEVIAVDAGTGEMVKIVTETNKKLTGVNLVTRRACALDDPYSKIVETMKLRTGRFTNR